MLITIECSSAASLEDDVIYKLLGFQNYLYRFLVLKTSEIISVPRISNEGKNLTSYNVITVNTRTQRRSEDDNDRRKRSTDDSSISEQPYAMKAYVSGETNFTITQGTLTAAMKYSIVYIRVTMEHTFLEKHCVSRSYVLS